MKNTILKTTIALVLGATLFTGCSVDDLKESDPINPSSVGSKNDKLTVTPTNGGKGFLVFWKKNAGSYGEVIYTSSLSKKRGNGYPLTSNTTGLKNMSCTMRNSNSEEATFACKPSSGFPSTVYLKTGVQYKWLVNYGFDHEKGEVEALMEYHGNGTITVE